MAAIIVSGLSIGAVGAQILAGAATDAGAAVMTIADIETGTRAGAIAEAPSDTHTR
jgi:hypothetical protein